MELFFGIGLFVMSFLSILILFVIRKESENIVPSALIGAFIAISTIAGIAIINEHLSPSIKPIDVYRGKTTLEITYRDSIAIDSVVVWKEEVK